MTTEFIFNQKNGTYRTLAEFRFDESFIDRVLQAQALADNRRRKDQWEGSFLSAFKNLHLLSDNNNNRLPSESGSGSESKEQKTWPGLFSILKAAKVDGDIAMSDTSSADESESGFAPSAH